MNILLLKLAAASALLSLASGAMASANGGIIHFTGNIVEPPCSTGSFDAGKLAIHCDKRSAVAVSFQRVGPAASSAAAIVTLTRDGKVLGSQETTAYRMALQGNSQLGLRVAPQAAGAIISPVLMTISYL
jgi:type 1 fimbria pilin